MLQTSLLSFRNQNVNSIRTAARRAGALYFLFMIAGLIDLYGFPRFVVPGDAAATARSIMAGELTYRAGILTDFVTLVMFIPLVVSLYNLLKDVNKWHALLMVLLVSAGVAIGFVNLLNKIAPLILLSGGGGYLSVFTKGQLDALALGFLNLKNSGDNLCTAFWGLWLFPFGVLVIRSGFLPRILGILLIFAGVGNLTTGVTSLIWPSYEQIVSKVMTPLYLGEFPIIFYLLIKGARVRNGEEGPPRPVDASAVRT